MGTYIPSLVLCATLHPLCSVPHSIPLCSVLHSIPLCVMYSLDGVQLLCLIDKGLDGCRYLQTYGEWQTAAWLAKATLSERDCSEVFTKWADHLASVAVSQKVRYDTCTTIAAL